MRPLLLRVGEELRTLSSSGRSASSASTSANESCVVPPAFSRGTPRNSLAAARLSRLVDGGVKAREPHVRDAQGRSRLHARSGRRACCPAGCVAARPAQREPTSQHNTSSPFDNNSSSFRSRYKLRQRFAGGQDIESVRRRTGASSLL